MWKVKVGAAIGIAVLTALGIWFAFSSGYDSGRNEAQAACQERIAAQMNEFNQAQDRANEAAQNRIQEAREQERLYWESQQETEIVYETIEKEVVKYVEADNDSDCRVDDEFMRIWNAANAGRNTTRADPGS